MRSVSFDQRALKPEASTVLRCQLADGLDTLLEAPARTRERGADFADDIKGRGVARFFDCDEPLAHSRPLVTQRRSLDRCCGREIARIKQFINERRKPISEFVDVPQRVGASPHACLSHLDDPFRWIAETL